MSATSAHLISLIVVISTLLLAIFGVIIVRYIFQYQHKRYRHEQEVLELREAFSKTLLQSRLEIQEQTLDHIAKELHANFSHLVSLININLSEILPQSTSSVQDSILETKSLAKQLLSELKALSASLNTDLIMQIGFVKALDNELTRLGKTKKFQVTFSRTGTEFRLSPEQEIILFRLCQEVLNNVLKYSKAASLSASLHYSPDLFTLEIADDGIGFDIDKVILQSAENESTGLFNIRKRARLIGGDALIVSKPDHGTTVRISIPRKHIEPFNL
ncbi:MAG TPA: ATP-binding protein [Puia sp.]|nr:ATP-binding protein [Puia sp.]